MPYVERRRIKTYVDVDTHTDRAGNVSPVTIYLPDGRSFGVTRTLSHCSEYRNGVKVVRFNVRVGPKETHLFYEQPRWYVEVRPTGASAAPAPVPEDLWIGDGAGL